MVMWVGGFSYFMRVSDAAFVFSERCFDGHDNDGAFIIKCFKAIAKYFVCVLLQFLFFCPGHVCVGVCICETHKQNQTG